MLLSYTTDGQTGSGKSHSMIGDAHTPGLIPRFLTTLLNLAQKTHVTPPAAADTSHDSSNHNHSDSSYSIEVRHECMRDT